VEIRDIIDFQKRSYPVLEQYRILSLSDIGWDMDVEETSDTLEGNALLKARTLFSRYQGDCFADDTGLEVEILGGRPGVHSARYAGEEKQFDKNIAKLLSEIQNQSNRKARFRTVISLILEGREFLFEGTINGKIIHERRGSLGFGYDSVFVPDGFETTFAEMSPENKNTLSHRYRAMLKMVEFLSLLR
jgi:XTP/dITP diphosphohydrolase